MTDNYASLINDLQRYKLYKNDLSKKVKKFINRKDIELDIRWNLFIYSGLGDKGCDYGPIPYIDWDDSFSSYCEGNIVNVSEFVKSIGICNFFTFIDEEMTTEENIMKLKEFFMEEFIYTFVYVE